MTDRSPVLRHSSSGSAERQLLTRDQVVNKLAMTGTIFARWLKRKEAEGFPPPVLGRGRGARWDPAAIDAWLDSRMPAHLRPELRHEGPTGEIDLDAWRDKLRDRIPEAVGLG